jgi:PleD family two-component response regulator
MNEESLRGHTSADEALKSFAAFHMGKLVERFGYKAKLGRLSGDEFAFVISNSNEEEVNQFFSEIEEERKEKMEVIKEREGLPSDITAMRAIVTAEPGDTFETIHERADAHLIEQKRIRNLQQLEQMKEQEV